MSLHKDIQKQIQDSMRARDAVRTTTLRGVLTSFTNELVAKKRKPNEELSDEDALDVIRRGVKQRKDSIEQFRKGGREDLAQSEEAELKILETYLPAMMPVEEVEKIARAKASELGITDKSKAGQLMGAVMKELKGKADSADVKNAVDSILQ
jgi:hypothetical protein